MGRRDFIKNTGILAASVLIGSSAYGCAQPEKKSIVIGHQADLTGFLAGWGKWHAKFAQAAIDKINEEGGINGMQVQYVVEDTESRPDVAQQKLRKLVLEHKADFVLGTVHSGAGIACTSVAKELKTIYMPRGHAVAITEGKGNRYVFRSQSNVRSEVQATFKCLEREGLVGEFGKKWAVIYVDYAYGQSHRDEFKKMAKQLNLEVVAEIPVPVGTKDFVPYLTKIPQDVDAIYYLMVGPAESSGLISQMHELGLTDKPRLTDQGSIEFIDLFDYKDALENTWIHYHAMPQNPGKFDTPYYKEIREIMNLDDYFRPKDNPKEWPPTCVVNAWEDVFLLKEAAEMADYKDKKDTPKVIQALEDLRVEESLEHPRGDLYMRAQDHQSFYQSWLAVFEGGEIKVKYNIPLEDHIYPTAMDYTKEEF